ncbi:hypothetical protein XENOCAPTIV_010725, partial [Xenoophorus captivus]
VQGTNDSSVVSKASAAAQGYFRDPFIQHFLCKVARRAPLINRSDAVISWAAKLLPQSLFVIYEQIHPEDPFGRVMQDHFLKLNSALHALQLYPDLSAQRRRFLDKGWDHCVCLDMNDFYLGLLSQEERDRIESLEPFDEHEVS